MNQPTASPDLRERAVFKALEGFVPERWARSIATKNVLAALVPVAGREPDPAQWLANENRLLKLAGDALAVAAMRVTDESDGVHRLRLAVAAWSKAIADEGGRGAAPTAPETGEPERAKRRLRCGWCKHEWTTTLQMSDYESCPKCRGWFAPYGISEIAPTVREKLGKWVSETTEALAAEREAPRPSPLAEVPMPDTDGGRIALYEDGTLSFEGPFNDPRPTPIKAFTVGPKGVAALRALLRDAPEGSERLPPSGVRAPDVTERASLVGDLATAADWLRDVGHLSIPDLIDRAADALTLAAERERVLEAFVAEVVRGPYGDSDPESLLASITARARAITREASK